MSLRRIRAGVLAAIVLAACSSRPTALEQQIRAEYDLLERAYAAQDLPAILATRHPDFEMVVPATEGEIEDHARFVELMRMWFVKNKPPIEAHFTIESIEARSAGEVAVRILQRISRYQGEGQRLRHVVHEVRQRETWVRTPSGWKVRRVDEIDLANRKVWDDGKAIPLEDQ